MSRYASVLALLVLVVAPGCRKGPEERSTLGFHADAVRTLVENLRSKLDTDFAAPPPPGVDLGGRAWNPGVTIYRASEVLHRALSELPMKVEKRATTRVPERKQAAEKALKYYMDEIQPVVVSLKYDPNEVRRKLDELLKIIDEVERS